ncbi:MAG: hypothetical protein WCK15_24135, partial [Pirellula sp.]
NSAVVITFGGSFNESSLANPDMNATGDNWVHKIDRNWASPTQWSITETVISVYSLGDSETTVHDVADLAEGDSGNEGSGDSNEGDGTDEPSELEETGSWETTISTSRRGFVIMTLHASMGITSPVAAGVLWSISLNYSDSVTVGAVAGGGSSFAPAEKEGDAASSGSAGRGTGVPPDFEGSADWGASFGVTARSGGTIYITSTPSLASDGSIRSTVDAEVTYDIGGDANFRSNWSSSSQSGDLELPDLSGCEMTSAGLTTSKIVLVHAWDIDGTEDELADTLKNDSVSASLSGQMVLDPDGSTAEILANAGLRTAQRNVPATFDAMLSSGSCGLVDIGSRRLQSIRYQTGHDE